VTATVRWILGPELFWLAVYALTHVAARYNEPASAAGNLLLKKLSWALPVVAIPLSFLVFFRFPRSEPRRHVMRRLALATLVGLNVCLFHVIDAIDYGDTRNAGVLGFWMIGILLGGLVFLTCGVTLSFARRRGWAQ